MPEFMRLGAPIDHLSALAQRVRGQNARFEDPVEMKLREKSPTTYSGHIWAA